VSASVPLPDQARELRRIVEQNRQKKRNYGRLRTIAVLSGKGGVGKSNLSINLACALAEQGKRVVLLDADLGLANIDMLCGISVKYHLAHLIAGSKSVDEILVELERNVWILPGGSGIKELAELDEARLDELIESLGVLEDRADILLIDTGAGIHHGVLAFAAAADTTILVMTPEPTAIRDAYGVLKVLKSSEEKERKHVVSVVNMVSNEREGQEVANTLRRVASQFLDFPVHYIGCILKDRFVELAVRSRKPFYQLYPDSSASGCVRKLVQALGIAEIVTDTAPKGLKSFFLRLLQGRLVER
jgi:flagellar biosynthesis protein FlhG